MTLPSPRIAAALVLGASLALLLGALAFQYVGGYPPCVLCHWQRYAHVGAALFAAVALTMPRLWDPLESTCRHASLSIL